ncbi:MAG TPA: hypothetical protein VHJ76_03410 [Actinomycetota bacterium]|nr:hypothetical protein [Actinomycetota bacterium]
MRRGIILLTAAALMAGLVAPARAADTAGDVPAAVSVEEATAVLQDAGVDVTQAEVAAAIEDAGRSERGHDCRLIWAHFWLTVCYWIVDPYPPGQTGVKFCLDYTCVTVIYPLEDD